MSIQVSSVPEQTGLSSAAQQRTAFLDRLISLTQQAPTAPSWIQTLREQAIARVQEQAFPTTRNEEWRFTDLSDLAAIEVEGVRESFGALREQGSESPSERFASEDQAKSFELAEAATSRLVFVNGTYSAELSSIANLPDSLIIGNLSQLADQYGDRLQPYLAKQSGAEELFTALNTAALTDAAIVLVPKNLEVETPIHLLFLSTVENTAFIQPRCLVVAERNSAVTIVEEYCAIGQGQSFTNAVTEIWIEENAQVSHTRIQSESFAAFHIGKTAISQARDSRYTCNAIGLGATLSRHHLEIYQTGEQTQTTLNGLMLLRGEQVGDTHSAIALTKPYGMTRQLQKCIIDDRAHAVFNGKVFVPKAAQLTDAGQLNQNLLLSSKARVDTKPQLEIVADNVKCTHGATVGQLDEDEVFYLQSRGIDATSARKLLVYAFAYEIIDKVAIASLKQKLSDLITTLSS